MNNRQRKFVTEYLVDLNSTQAAIRAGYSAKCAESKGPKLMAVPEIRRAVQARLSKQLAKRELKVESILDGLLTIASANIMHFGEVNEQGQFEIDLRKATLEQCYAVQEISTDHTGGTGDGERRQILRTKLRLPDKLKALELLGQYFKLFVQKVEHDASEELLNALADRIAVGRKRVAIGPVLVVNEAPQQEPKQITA